MSACQNDMTMKQAKINRQTSLRHSGKCIGHTHKGNSTFRSKLLSMYAKYGLSENMFGSLVTEYVWMLSIKIKVVYVQIKV